MSDYRDTAIHLPWLKARSSGFADRPLLEESDRVVFRFAGSYFVHGDIPANEFVELLGNLRVSDQGPVPFCVSGDSSRVLSEALGKLNFRVTTLVSQISLRGSQILDPVILPTGLDCDLCSVVSPTLVELQRELYRAQGWPPENAGGRVALELSALLAEERLWEIHAAGKPIGKLDLHFLHETGAWLGGLVLDPAWRGRGLGTTFLFCVVQRLALQEWDIQVEPMAVEGYLRHGLQKMGELCWLLAE